MSRTLALEREAQHDLDETFDYIAQDNPDAAAAYIRGAIDKASEYASNPQMGQHELALSERLNVEVRSFLYRNHRCFFVFSASELRVLRFLHTARDIESILRRYLDG